MLRRRSAAGIVVHSKIGPPFTRLFRTVRGSRAPRPRRARRRSGPCRRPASSRCVRGRDSRRSPAPTDPPGPAGSPPGVERRAGAAPARACHAPSRSRARVLSGSRSVRRVVGRSRRLARRRVGAGTRRAPTTVGGSCAYPPWTWCAAERSNVTRNADHGALDHQRSGLVVHIRPVEREQLSDAAPETRQDVDEVHQVVLLRDGRRTQMVAEPVEALLGQLDRTRGLPIAGAAQLRTGLASRASCLTARAKMPDSTLLACRALSWPRRSRTSRITRSTPDTRTSPTRHSPTAARRNRSHRSR